MNSKEQLKKPELKPCPFCGGKPDINNPDSVYPVTLDRKVYRAGCIESAGGCGAEVLGWSIEDAIEKWNTRHE